MKDAGFTPADLTGACNHGWRFVLYSTVRVYVNSKHSSSYWMLPKTVAAINTNQPSYQHM